MTRMFRLMLGVLLAATATAVWADFKAGLGPTPDRESYLATRDQLLKTAEQGDAEAQFLVGEMHHEGGGLTRDYGKAAEWYGKAAQQGYAPAHYRLATMHYLGRGLSQDLAKAAEHYRQAAMLGLAEAQFSLGALYANGEGVAQDYVQAWVWFALAAEQGLAEAAQSRDHAAELMSAAQLEQARTVSLERAAKHTPHAAH